MLQQAGDLEVGQTYDVSDRQGKRLVATGYARELVARAGEQAMVATDDRPNRGRAGRRREVREQ